MINDVPAAPFNLTTAPPLRATLVTQTTVGFPVAVIVVAEFRFPRVTEHGRAAAFVTAVFAAATSALKSWFVRTCPMEPELLFWKVAPGASRMLPFTNSLPVNESLPAPAMQMSPWMPPGGPVMDTDAASSSSTAQPVPVAAPSAGLAHVLLVCVLKQPWLGLQPADWQMLLFGQFTV